MKLKTLSIFHIVVIFFSFWILVFFPNKKKDFGTKYSFKSFSLNGNFFHIKNHNYKCEPILFHKIRIAKFSQIKKILNGY
jgi:hypothetical protein